MVEGELKKRILGFNDITKQECDYSCRLDGKKFPKPDRTQIFIKFSDVDEAKKEWLEIEETELPIKTNGKVDWQKTAEIMELRNIIRNKWFLKWFGESKEE